MGKSSKSKNRRPASTMGTRPPAVDEPEIVYANPSDRTSARSWKQASQSEGRDVRLPSGNVALLRRISPEAFLASETLPDPIIGMVEKSIREKRGLRPEDEKELMSDPKMLKGILSLVDTAVVQSVMDPKVAMTPATGEPRDADVLYVDEVDFQDKMFIFNWSMGGTKDIARFHDEFSANVARVSDVQDVEDESK